MLSAKLTILCHPDEVLILRDVLNEPARARDFYTKATGQPFPAVPTEDLAGLAFTAEIRPDLHRRRGDFHTSVEWVEQELPPVVKLAAAVYTAMYGRKPGEAKP